MKTRISVLAAAALFFGAATALAQSTTGSMGTTGITPGAPSTIPGTAPNGTTPGAVGNGMSQSLQGPSAGTGLGYSPMAPSLGVSPDAIGSTTYDPNASLPPMPSPSPGGTGSSASGPGSPSGG